MRSSSPISGSVLDLDSKLAAAASKEEEEEGGDEERKGKRRNEFEFDLSEDLYEEECSFKSEICAEIDITLKGRVGPSVAASLRKIVVVRCGLFLSGGLATFYEALFVRKFVGPSVRQSVMLDSMHVLKK